MTTSPGPALAMLDVADVPHGLLALDALAKEAEVTILAAGTVQAGRYFLLFGGDLAACERSYDRAVEAIGSALCDSVLLPYAEPRLVPAISDAAVRWPAPGDTLGVLQSATPPVLLRALDAALKGALVELVQLRVGDGLAGKGFATVWGETHDVEAAVEIAEDAAAPLPSGWSTAVIRNADAAVGEALAPQSRFFGEWRG